MPELPEVETVCRGLAKALAGAQIIHAAAHRANLRTPIPQNLGNTLKNRRIVTVTRRAKYIQIELDDGMTLLLHLGMSGRMVLLQHDLPLTKHDHLSFAFANGMYARFNDPRRFGSCDLVPTAELASHKSLADLGVEPFDDALTPSVFGSLLQGRKTPIKLALLDQKLVVGVGNIYACEALFRAHIHPERAAGSCTAKEVKGLLSAVRAVLTEAIDAGGSSLRDYVQADGELGYFQHHFAVYGREGETCSNSDKAKTKHKKIERISQGGRSTFYCPTCQK